MVDHEHFMSLAFKQAQLGVGSVSPNPLVGSILTKGNRIIGKGYHQKYGDKHAEVNAIEQATENVEGATLYCNLEPCCHTNKQTPPCTDLLISRKIKKIVISNLDPNPYVSGKGVEQLRNAGVEVITGVLEEEGKRLNEIFFKYITTDKPFVHLKFAQTLDGKIASSSGDAKWISNTKARMMVHEWRYGYDAILVGRKTLSTDNPSLTSRLNDDRGETSPYRIIVGNPNNMDRSSKVFSDRFKEKTIICTSMKSDDFANVCYVKSIDGRVDLNDMLLKLGKKKITSILIEGGTEIIGQFLKEKTYDKITIFVAPKIVGGDKSYCRNIDIDRMEDAMVFDNNKLRIIDDQIMIEGYVHRNN